MIRDMMLKFDDFAGFWCFGDYGGLMALKMMLVFDDFADDDCFLKFLRMMLTFDD